MSIITVWPIDRTLSGVTTPGQRGPGINEVGYAAFLKALALLGPYYQIVELKLEGVLPLWRNTVSIFYCPSQQGLINMRRKTTVCVTVHSASPNRGDSASHPLIIPPVGYNSLSAQLMLFYFILFYFLDPDKRSIANRSHRSVSKRMRPHN